MVAWWRKLQLAATASAVDSAPHAILLRSAPETIRVADHRLFHLRSSHRADLHPSRRNQVAPRRDLRRSRRDPLRPDALLFGPPRLDPHRLHLGRLPRNELVHAVGPRSSFGARLDPMGPLAARHRASPRRHRELRRITPIVPGNLLRAGIRHRAYLANDPFS